MVDGFAVTGEDPDVSVSDPPLINIAATSDADAAQSASASMGSCLADAVIFFRVVNSVPVGESVFVPPINATGSGIASAFTPWDVDCWSDAYWDGRPDADHRDDAPPSELRRFEPVDDLPGVGVVDQRQYAAGVRDHLRAVSLPG